MMKPTISSLLLKTNYEGMGEQDKEEFERDFDEILDLAQSALEDDTLFDAISREKAICVINDGRLTKLIDADVAIDSIKRLPHVKPEQKWIPCSERLPEDYEDVLITYTHPFELTCPQETAKLLKGVKTVSGDPLDPKLVWEVPFADYIAFYDVDEKRWFSSADNPEPFPDEMKVIAWMPLPKPYGGGTE